MNPRDCISTSSSTWILLCRRLDTLVCHIQHPKILYLEIKKYIGIAYAESTSLARRASRYFYGQYRHYRKINSILRNNEVLIRCSNQAIFFKHLTRRRCGSMFFVLNHFSISLLIQP